MKLFKGKIGFILKLFGVYKRQALWLLFLILFSAFLESFGVSLIMPILQTGLQDKIDAKFEIFLRPILALSGNSSPLAALTMFFLLVMALKFILVCMSIFFSKRFVWRMRLEWINKIFEKYMHCNYSFILNAKQGELINTLISETHRGVICCSQMIEFTAKAVLAIFLTAALLYVDWKITFLSLGAIVILIFSTHTLSRKFAQNIGRKRLLLAQQLAAWVAESIVALRQIKTFGLENFIIKNQKKVSTSLSDVNVRFEVVKSLHVPFGEFFMALLIVGIIVFSDLLFHVPFKLLIPVLGVFVVVGVQLTTCMSQLAGLRLQIIALMPALRLSYHVANDLVKGEDFKSGNVFKKIQNDIAFNDVSFSYGENDSVRVFRHLNLNIPQGKMTAIIGPSGIGKSTIADLLLRLYDPQEGRISVNGDDLRHWNLRDWRSRIGFVSQDTFIFNTSIRENIAFGNLGVNEQTIIEAAKKAYAHDFIMQLPQGYDTIVGERGLKLSGGQRQRIAIARAIVRDPDLFIFDEATSSLDHESEQMVQKAIENLGQEKTMLIIAHRLTTIEKADVVYDLGKMTDSCALASNAMKNRV
ncbi:MAG: ABC transporter ATP-binding protein/permease [Candidatus Omnitrophica bacterium]|nr:ABC transporter ATP-binding protein/permease [Candidatus Omnitrophota bacterium]